MTDQSIKKTQSLEKKFLKLKIQTKQSILLKNPGLLTIIKILTLKQVLQRLTRAIVQVNQVILLKTYYVNYFKSYIVYIEEKKLLKLYSNQ